MTKELLEKLRYECGHDSFSVAGCTNCEAADTIQALEFQFDAQLEELCAISEALGTSEGHSSVYWIEQLKQQCSDPALDFCHRFAVLMECMILSDKPHNCWDEANSLLEQYHLALEEWREANGEPYVSGFGKD